MTLMIGASDGSIVRVKDRLRVLSKYSVYPVLPAGQGNETGQMGA